MIDSKIADMQLYDIYDVIYTPWWQKGWFLGTLGILCIFLCFFCFVAYRKYGRKKALPVDFFISAQNEIALYKEMMEKNPEKVDTQKLYNALISIFKQAYFTYANVDFFNKTGTDLKEALKQRGVQNQALYDFLDSAENARFSKYAACDSVITHLEYMQSFLIKIVQNKAIKQK